MYGPEHVVAGLAPMTAGADGHGFDWDRVLAGLFEVHWAAGKHPPACAHVAICYEDFWFYIDERDQDTKSSFSLLVELSRLELGAKTGTGPILTLPLGGR